MKSYLFLLLASFAFFSCDYEIPTEDLIKFKIVDHQNNSLELDLESSKQLLNAAKYTNEKYFWKGSRKGILTYDDGRTKEIKISGYGGFFYSEEHRKFFNIPHEYKRDWEDLIWEKNKN